MHWGVNYEMVECIYFLTAWWTEQMLLLKLYWLFTKSLTSLWSWKSSVFLLRFFFLAQVQLSTRESSRVYHFSKIFLVVWKNRNPPWCCSFLVSLAYKNKSVELKKRKHKKSNVSRICKREKTRKNIEKSITNLQSTVHYKKNHRDRPCFPRNP